MAQSNWEPEKMLDVYIHDYFLKRNLNNSAKAFLMEGKVAKCPLAIDAPGGLLLEWWSVFWDIFIAHRNKKHSESAARYIETQQLNSRENRLQLQLRRDPDQPPLGSPLSAMNSEGMMGQPSASVLARMMYEERVKHPNSMDSEGSLGLIDGNRMSLRKSTINHQEQSVQHSSGVSAALQQMQGRLQLPADTEREVNLGGAQRSLPMDPSSIYGKAILQSKSGLGGAGLNEGVTGLTMRGWPLTDIDQLRPSLALQVQKFNLQTQNQFLSPHKQVLIQAQAEKHGNDGNAANYSFGGLPRRNLNAKDGQPPKNDGSICCPVQSTSPKMGQMQQPSSQQQDKPQQQLQQQQAQNNRKRKQHSSSGPANSTGTRNTLGPSPSSPASTHTPGDGMNSASKNLGMHGAEGTGGISSSTNQLDDVDHIGHVGSLKDPIKSFLSNDGGNGIYDPSKQTLTEHKTEPSKGLSFGEVGCIPTRNKVTCCHFSSDGKLLASAGHDKKVRRKYVMELIVDIKVVLWNTDTLQTETTPDEHQHLITDIRFRPNSTQLATASFDKSVRLWDAANPGYCVHAYTGHPSHVMSLDFNRKKNDIFCFCDSNNEIRYWNISSFTCARVSKQGGSAQVRFQPVTGHLLAAASDKVVSIYDVEKDMQTHLFQGHSSVVNYLSWDLTGDYLASVSEDCVKVWSLTSGDCIHELNSNENQFHSCVFHPSYSSLLVIGGLRSMELWNMINNKSMTVRAHENIISSLAHSQVTGMIASSSHDSTVKLWK